MRIPLALLKGAILGLVLIGAVIFRGYTPQTLDESFSVMFFSWITVEGILMMLLPRTGSDESDS